MNAFLRMRKFQLNTKGLFGVFITLQS